MNLQKMSEENWHKKNKRKDIIIIISFRRKELNQFILK